MLGAIPEPEFDSRVTPVTGPSVAETAQVPNRVGRNREIAPNDLPMGIWPECPGTGWARVAGPRTGANPAPAPTRTGGGLSRTTGHPQYVMSTTERSCRTDSGQNDHVGIGGLEMGHVSLGVHIDAPIAEVWETSVDCTRLLEWSVSFVEVRDCSGRIDRVGAGYTAVARILGRPLDTRWETTKVEPLRLIEEKGEAPGGGSAHIAVSFADAGGGTDVSTEFEYTLPGGLFSGVLEKLAAGSVERDLRHSNENLKALCESAATAAASAPR